MTQKIALVTGANKGIGLETVRQLAQLDFHVILSARDQAKGEQAITGLKAEGINAEFLLLDMASSESIQSAARSLSENFSHLDVLINNAGINLDTTEDAIENIPVQRYRDTFDTNFFGLIELTQALIPLLKKAPAARIVNLSSILSSLTYHAQPGSPTYDFKWAAYDASKTALNAYTVHLAYALRDTNIKVNSAHPGWVKTDMGGEGALMEITDGAKTSVQLATLPEDGPTAGLFHMGQPLPW